MTRSARIIGWSAFAVVALAPLPLGSNRPFFWALWAALLGALGLCYLVSIRATGQEMRVLFGTMRGIASAFLLVAGFMLIQMLPLGVMFPIEFANRFGDVFVSATLSAAPGETAFALLRWASYGALYSLLVQAAVEERRRRLLMRGLLAVAVAEAAYALLALTLFDDTILFFAKTYYAGVATGTFVNRNTLATFLGLGLVLATAMITRGRRTDLRRVMLLACMLLLFAALLATQSRMGLLATLAGVACVLTLRRAGGGFVAVAAVAAGIGTMLALHGGGVAERFFSADNSAVDRLTLYRHVLAMILERPLSGYGAGTFALAFPLFHEPSLEMSLTWDHAHSTYLSLWAGMGLVVGSIPLLIVAAIIVRVVRGSSWRSVEGAAALGATVTVGLHSLVDFSLEMQGVAFFYVALLALGSAPSFAGDVVFLPIESDAVENDCRIGVGERRGGP